ncbi:MAG: DUF1992 domain-containing protein [Thermomicrobiales bacterium]|nr:DUF1992 domain-containing protein [Thermomicrobiales bacterium]
MVIDLHGRCKLADTQAAVHNLNGQLTVCSRFVAANTVARLQLINQLLAAGNVTGCAMTEKHEVIAGWLRPKISIESQESEDAILGNAEMFANNAGRFRRHPANEMLYVLASTENHLLCFFEISWLVLRSKQRANVVQIRLADENLLSQVCALPLWGVVGRTLSLQWAREMLHAHYGEYNIADLPHNSGAVPEERRMFERIAEEKIREAIDRGDFENLRSSGKRLAAQDDDYTGDDWMGNHILHNAGFLPEWLELRKQIYYERPHVLEAVAEWRDLIRQYGTRHALSVRAGENYRKLATAINAKIDLHNIRCPGISFELGRFREDALPPDMPV